MILEKSQKIRLSVFVLFNLNNKMNATTPSVQNYTQENATYGFQQTELFFSGPEPIAIIVIISVIFFVGILGNVALLSYVICCNRLTSPHNIYSTNLAVGDLLTLIVAMPFLSSIYIMTTWPFGELVCKFSEFTYTLSTSITVFMITALSVERYRLLTLHPPSLNLTSASVTSFILWLLAIMLAIPDLVSAETLAFGDFRYCVPYRVNWGETYAKTMVAIKFTCHFAGPLFIITACYCMIGRNLISRKSQFHSCLYEENHSASEEEVLRHSKRKRMAALVLGLVLLYVLTWLPRHVYVLWYHFDSSPYDTTWHIIKLVGICLMYCNSALNPVVFFCFDSTFRDCVCFCCRKPQFQRDLEEYTEIPHNSIVLTEINQCQDATNV